MAHPEGFEPPTFCRRSRSGVRAGPPTRRPRSELGGFARL